MATNYKFYCPYDQPPHFEEEDFPMYKTAIDDVLDCSSSIEIIELQNKRYKPKIFKRDYKPKRQQNEYKCFLFELDIKGDFKDPHQMSYQIYYFLALTQIAHPKIFDCEEIDMYVDDTYYNTSVSMKSFVRDSTGFMRNEWPELRTIPLSEIYKWLNKNKISFIKKSTGSAQRGLLAILQIFSSGNYSISHHLMWAMNGIEALYNEDKTHKIAETLMRYFHLAALVESITIKSDH